MSNVYYKVEFKIDHTPYECGPYLSLEQATDILANHIPVFANSIAVKKKYNYEAKVQECTFTEEGLWKILNTLIVENKCQKLKKIA